MFMQPLSNRHSCCHQKLPSHQTDNHENQGGPMSESPSTSSVYSSQCTDSCKKSPLLTSSSPMTFDECSIIRAQLPGKRPTQADHCDLIRETINCSTNHSTAKKIHTARVHFIDSTTSTEPSSLSLLFEQSAHTNDPIGSSHVINAQFVSFIEYFLLLPLHYFIELLSFTKDNTISQVRTALDHLIV